MLKYRFKQDNGSDYPDWEEKRINEFAIVNMGQSPTSSSYNFDGIGIPLLQGNADIVNYEAFSERFTSQPTKICEANDIIMTVRAPVGEVGFAKTKSCLGRGVCSVKSLNFIDSYLFYLFLSNKNKWKKSETGSTFKAINKESLKKISMYCSINTEEQQKIADFLSAVDNQIDIQRQRVEVMETQKKGLLDKVFSQELRFKQDDGSNYPDWEEKNVKSLCIRTVGGGTPSTKNPNYYKGNIPWISSSDVGETIAQPFESRFITKEAVDESATKLIPADSVLVVSRVGVGKVALTKHEVCTSQDFTNLILKLDYNATFIAYLMRYTMPKQATQGTSIKGIKSTDIKNIKVLVPQFEEQQKIADFFTAIDNQIDIEKQRLTIMETIKKGLLQQMFC